MGENKRVHTHTQSVGPLGTLKKSYIVGAIIHIARG